MTVLGNGGSSTAESTGASEALARAAIPGGARRSRDPALARVDAMLRRSLDCPAPMQLKVLYHGNCFDGCASAALFSRYFVAREGGRLDAVRFVPLQHQQGDPFPKDAFDADVNACVDFRFSPSPGLHWWFDHHASAFPTPAERAAFERDTSGRKFWDPTAPSC